MADSKNVRVAVTGAVYVGGVSHTPPAGFSQVPGMKDLGYVSDAGITESRSRETKVLKAWQNSATVRETVTSADLTVKFALIETTKEALELYYGSAVTQTDEHGEINVDPAKQGDRHSFIIDVIDDEQLIRTWIPEGQITEIGDQVYSSGELIGYEVTIKAYPVSIDGQSYAAKKYYSGLVKTTPTVGS